MRTCDSSSSSPKSARSAVDFRAWRHQRLLGQRLHHHALPHGTALRLVGVQQPLGRPAVDRRGQLPAEVHRVLKTEVEARTTHRRVDVRGVAEQEHVADPVGLRQPGVRAVHPTHRMRAGPLRQLERHVRAEDPPSALPKVLQAHRWRVGTETSWLDGGEQRSTMRHLEEDVATAFQPVVPISKRAEAGNLVAAVSTAQCVGQVDVGKSGHRVGGTAGEGDADGLADQTATAVGTDQVRGVELIAVTRRVDGDRDTCAHPGSDRAARDPI